MPINLSTSGKPLYRRIHEAILEKITSGEWPEGHMIPTRRELAEDLHTTRDTIGKAIAELVRDGWLAASAGSGTYVTARDGTPVPSPSRTPNPAGVFRIGVIYPPPFVTESPYYTELLRGIRTAIERPDVATTFFAAGNKEYAALVQSGLDGLIVMTPSTNEMLRLYEECGDTPFVVVGNSIVRLDQDEHPAIPCVDTTHRKGAYDAVKHLIDLGHKRIAVVNTHTSSVNHHQRLQGYLDALTEAGLSVRPDDLVLYPERITSQPWLLPEAWISRASRERGLPTAVFACDLDDGLWTLAALRRHGVGVPSDMSIVCFDDSPILQHTTPAITAIRQPVFEMGYRAAERLLSRFQNGLVALDDAGVELLPIQFVLRNSTTAPKP